jgi:hypothetical protein
VAAKTASTEVEEDDDEAEALLATLWIGKPKMTPKRFASPLFPAWALFKAWALFI